MDNLQMAQSTPDFSGFGQNEKMKILDMVDMKQASSKVGLFSLKGIFNATMNPNYPAAIAGDAYQIATNPLTPTSRIGGVAGAIVENKDFLLCLVDTAGGDEAAAGADFEILQGNVDVPAITAAVVAAIPAEVALQLPAALVTAGYGFVKVTKSIADWKPNAGAFGYVIIPLPAGAIPTCLKVKHSVAFSGGTVATATIEIVDAANASYSGTPMIVNVFAGVSVIAGGFTSDLQNAASIPSQDAQSDINAKLTLTGDVIDNCVNGTVNIWVFYAIAI